MSSDVKMMVMESNGEISASVEETNRVRQQLGLKPLAEGNVLSKEAEAIARGREMAIEAAKESEENALREKLEDAKRKRLLNQKLKGGSLGEMLEGEEMDSAMAWIEKSRRQEQARKEQRKDAKLRKPKTTSAEQLQSQRYDEMDAEVSELAGALVGHSAADFKAGESVVLTLADEPVLVEEGNSYQINEKDEMLENVNMAEDWRRQHNKELATHGKYNPYGDNPNILSKYDEDAGRSTLTLDARGTVDEAKAKKLAAIKEKLAATAGGAQTTSFDLSAEPAKREFQPDDDYQMAEPVEFKKPVLKSKKLRKKNKGELGLEVLESSGTSGGGDHGSRQDRLARANEREAASELERESKRQRFEHAVAVAEVQAAQKLGGAVGEDGEEAGEVDDELYTALARARRLSAMQAEKRSEDFAAQRVAAQLEAVRRVREQNDQGGVELSSLEFSETGEFCKAVRTKDEASESADLPSAQYKQHKSGGHAGDVKVKVEHKAHIEGEQEETDRQEESAGSTATKGLEVLHEPAVGGGLSAALGIARSRGLLAEEREASGRMFDQKGAGLHNYADDEDNQASFQLNYHDEYGRKMTQKQAFRQLSWKFHGKGPSKKNREKRMLEVEKQMAEKTKDRAMEYMAALQQAQVNTKSAHVVLSGVNAIKPTDVARVRQAVDRAKQAKKKKGESGSGFDSSIPGRSGFDSAIPGRSGYDSAIPGRSGFESNIPGAGGTFIP